MLELLARFSHTHPALEDWLVTLAGALVATLVALVVTRTLWTVATRVAGRRVVIGPLLRHGRAPALALVACMALQFAWNAAPDDLPRLAGIERMTALALTAALVWLAIRGIGALTEVMIALHPVESSDNLGARRIQTRVRILSRVLSGLAVFVGLALALMTFPAVRALGASLLASAGVAGLVLGIAARPVLGNLIAGVQLALTQPIRLDDVVVIEGEWGRIEDIRSSVVVVRLWDERRLVVPLQWFIEHPFQNWTTTSARIVGTVFFWADYRLPLEPVRAELQRLCRAAKEWDGEVCVLQVTEAGERAIQLRALVSSADSGRNWDLRCIVREGLVAYLRDHHPECLPRRRQETSAAPAV